jgi:hypothetical protein
MGKISRIKLMRKEFVIILDRCGCSRASLSITPKEAREWMGEGLVNYDATHVPHCTPSRCFPNLYKFLYPKGGFHGESYMAKQERKLHKKKEEKENSVEKFTRKEKELIRDSTERKIKRREKRFHGQENNPKSPKYMGKRIDKCSNCGCQLLFDETRKLGKCLDCLEKEVK